MNNIMSKKSKIAVFADDKEIKKYFDEENMWQVILLNKWVIMKVYQKQQKK